MYRVYTDIQIVKEKINDLAQKLVELDTDKQYAEIVTIQNQIMALIINTEIIFKKTDNYGNDLYCFALLNNITAPFETVLKTVDENLRKYRGKRIDRKGKWNFDPKNGDFITTITKKTLIKIKNNDDSMLKGYIQLYDKTDSDGVTTGRAEDYADAVDYIAAADEKIANLQKIKYVAGMIINQTWVEKNKKNKQHFEGFFTHDRVTEERSTNGVYITDEYSNIIFPAMSIKLLEYLMEGSFSHMLDLVRNKVRNYINLTQCIDNVANCFGMKSPKYFHGQYKKWLISINPDK